eukprot:11419309-Ditylum_brightwellii.AAC.1
MSVSATRHVAFLPSAHCNIGGEISVVQSHEPLNVAPSSICFTLSKEVRVRAQKTALWSSRYEDLFSAIHRKEHEMRQ